MSNAKVRARRRRRGNRAWTAAMSPVELALAPLPVGATPALRVYVEHTCSIPTIAADYAEIETRTLAQLHARTAHLPLDLRLKKAGSR